MDARLETAWPLFGLRLRTEHLVLRMPTDDDLAELLQVAKAGIHPPDEMPFGVAWTSLTGPAFDRGFMQHYWGTRAAFSPENWFLNLMVELDGRPIGAQSVNAEGFPTFRTRPHRVVAGPRVPGTGPRQGDARRGAGLRLRRARRAGRRDRGIPRQRASNGVSRALGYEENGFDSLAPAGCRPRHPEIPDDRRRLALTAAPALAIEGLDGILDLFGAAPPTEPRSRRPSRRPRRPTNRR